MTKTYYCNVITTHLISKNCSTGAVSCAKYCSNYVIRIWLSSKLNFETISIMETWQRNGPMDPGRRFNFKISSYQYGKSHCRDKTVTRSSYLHNGISYTGKVTSLCWIRSLDFGIVSVHVRGDPRWGIIISPTDWVDVLPLVTRSTAFASM